ncbi:uncharacterized protein METZ01_LOCUS280497 [marine metagenome]|uniref:Uncharacterized protein n=1 Tax=marine metagenome TaxID=408172 RepID=A0A382KVR3_9ZZZZ
MIFLYALLLEDEVLYINQAIYPVYIL